MFRSRTRIIAPLLAMALCAVCVSEEHSPTQVLVERARLLDAQGRHDLAAENWRQILLLEPRQPESLAALAAYFRTTGDQAKAKYYQGLIDSSKPVSGAAKDSLRQAPAVGNVARLDEAARLAASHKYPEALEVFRKVFGTTPPDDWASVYYQTEAAIPAESANGIAGLRALAEKYPANPSYQLSLAQELTYRPATRAEGFRLLSSFQGTAAQNEQARAAWRKAILWDPASRAALEYSRLYLERYPDPELAARLGEAQKKGESAAETSPEEGAAYKALKAGRLTEATARFTALLKGGNVAHGELGLGYVSMKQKDFDTAVQHFKSASAKGMHNAALDKALQEAHYWSAMSNGSDALKANDTATATVEFQRAQEIDAHRPEATEALGDSMIAAKEPAQAEDIFAADARDNPGRADAWTGWMNALLEAGKFDRVIAMQQEIPSNVRLQLGHRPDYLAMLLCAELAQGNESDARMLRDRITMADSGAAASTTDVAAAQLLYRYSYFDDASRLAVAALNGSNGNAMAWQVLVESEHMAGRDRNAMTIISRMPRSVDNTAMSNAGFLLALASIYQSEGQLTNASAMLDRAQKLSGSDQLSLTQLEIQKGSLAMAQGDSQLAYETYQRISASSPDRVDAWIGMLNALHAGGRDAEALAAISELPEKVSSRIGHDAEYLQVAGFVYSATGHTREAMRCLRAVTDHYEQQHQPIPFGAGVALAWLQLDTGDQRPLAATLDQLSKRRGLSLAQTIAIQKVWSAWSMRRAEAAYTSGNTKQALAILQSAAQAYPGDTPLRIQLAGMYIRTGRVGQGMKMFQRMDWTNADVNQFTVGINAAITANSMSDAQYWLYLGLEKFPGNASILRAGAHLEERRGNLKAAEKYLKLAGGKDPDEQLEAATPTTAGNDTDTPAPSNEKVEPLPANDSQRLPDTTNGSSRASVTSDHSAESVDGITNEPSMELQSHPKPVYHEQESLSGNEALSNIEPSIYHAQSDTSLVRVAAGQEPMRTAVRKKTQSKVSNRDGSEGSDSFTSGMDSSDTPNADIHHAVVDSFVGSGLMREESGSRRMRADSPAPSLASLLIGSNESPTEEASASAAVNLEAELLGDRPVRHEVIAEVSASPSPMMAMPEPGMVRGLKSTQTPNPSDELQDLQARYSPWLLGGGSVETHSGTSGFDHLEHFEAGMGASTVLGTGTARISVVTRPVMLQSGVPDGKSNYRFGTGGNLPTSSLFAAGTSAGLEVATQNIQASIGMSPSGFLVNNVIGNFSYRPHAGPFTFNVYRASQKDSLLSYSGFKDPDTGEVWGGVVATGGSALYSKGSATSGFYASFDGQRLTGKNVTANTRIMGDVGAYWQPYFNQYGALKVGANLNVMHYSLNERYFTVGQGGYFSPDAFLLMNAPISWEGRPIYNTSYVISASIGAQSIQQAAAMPGSLITGNGAETSAGASYDLHLKIAHRMDPHWTIEGFLDANNARQYTDTAAGFALRYAARPQSGDMGAPGFLNLLEPLPLQAP